MILLCTNGHPLPAFLELRPCSRCKWNEHRRKIRMVRKFGPTILNVGLNRVIRGPRKLKRVEHRNVRVEVPHGFDAPGFDLVARTAITSTYPGWDISGYANATPGWSLKV